VLVAERHAALLGVEHEHGVELVRQDVGGGRPPHQRVLPLLLLAGVDLPRPRLRLALLARRARGREYHHLGARQGDGTSVVVCCREVNELLPIAMSTTATAAVLTQWKGCKEKKTGGPRRIARRPKLERQDNNQGYLRLHTRGEPSMCYLLCTHTRRAAANPKKTYPRIEL